MSNEDKPRIGVYVCHCGSNIAGVVDCAALREFAQDQPDVVVARENNFMCSSLGQEAIQKDIREQNLNRVVVCACSPHIHEKTFRGAVAQAGMNPFLVDMANIREHDSWITKDKPAALRKAKATLRGAVNRAALLQPLEYFQVKIEPATLVIGGGITGITATLELANGGSKVYLVEREPSIGGHMAQLDKTFPTLDCSACILTPKMVDAYQHPNVTVLSYSQVEKVEGYIGSFQVTVRKKARCIIEKDCTGCGLCEEKCPKKVLDNVFNAGLGYRKAIYRPFAQAVPKYPVIDKERCTYFESGKCGVCKKLCPTGCIDFEQQDEILQLEVGNIIVATGFDLFDCRRVPQYGYGRLANVFTSLEFERMVNSAGPTGGEISLRDGVTKPKSVGIVHCVGSRDRNYHEYCSKVCCMYSLKFAHLVHEKLPETEVYNFYIDMRTPGKGYEEFYHRLLAERTHFIRGRVAEVTDGARLPGEEGKLIVQVEDTLAGKQRRMAMDMVILSPAVEASWGSKEFSKVLGVGCDHEGFFVERHPKLDPVATMTEGIFVAGMCQGPKDVPESVAQGAAAAARVASLIHQGTVKMEPVRAHIKAEECSGCRICNTMCPYSAIRFVPEDKVSEVVTALCQGCGVCVAACPSGIITGAHFTKQQIQSQLSGILWDVREPEAVTV